MEKHAHAVVLGELIALAGGHVGSCTEAEVDALNEALMQSFPRQVRSYLIDEKGAFATVSLFIKLSGPFLHIIDNTSMMPLLIHLMDNLLEASAFVRKEALGVILDQFPNRLKVTSDLIHRRFNGHWTLGQG